MTPSVNLTNVVISRCSSHTSMHCESRRKFTKIQNVVWKVQKVVRKNKKDINT